MTLKLLVVCMSIILAVLHQSYSRSALDNHLGKRQDNPCLNAPQDGDVIITEQGAIICKSPSNEELEQRLKSITGMNHKYMASSLSQARSSFENLFKVYGKFLDNTTQWQDWRHSRPITSPYVDSVAQQVIDNAKREDGVVKRQSGGSVVIQCLPGGRLTEKGIHLCPACQRATELPTKYYPRYLNELTCDSSSSGNENQTSCYLTSFLPIGNCEQVTMIFDVLVHQPGNYQLTFQNATHTVYTAVYDEVPYEVRTCCECMVYSIYQFK